MKHAKMVGAAIALFGSLGLSATAEAAPLSPAPLGVTTEATNVGWACGPYGCVPYRSARPYWGGGGGYYARPFYRRPYYARPYYARPYYGRRYSYY